MLQHSEVYHLEEGCKSCKEVAQALIFEVFHAAEELGLKDEGKTSDQPKFIILCTSGTDRYVQVSINIIAYFAHPVVISTL